MIEGTVLAGRYVLGPRVGTGGMGTVHRAHDRVLDRAVAVKLLADALRPDERARARFTAEARAAAGLVHPNVVAVHDAGEHEGWPFFVMELVEGPSLADRLADGPFDVDDALVVARQVADGLAAAHAAGIVHRDVKPANVLFASDGVAKVSDFGIAAAAGVDLTTVHATLSHAAPELARGGAARPESDVYALGCLLTTMLTGAPPYPGETSAAQLDGHLHQPVPSLRSRRPAVPAAVDDLVARMLAKEPGDRPFPMAEVGARIAAAAHDEPTTRLAADDEATRLMPPPGATRVIGTPTPTAPVAGDGPPPTEPVDAAAAHAQQHGHLPAGSQPTRRRSWAVLAVLVVAAVATLLVGLGRNADDAAPVAATTDLPTTAAPTTPASPPATQTPPTEVPTTAAATSAATSASLPDAVTAMRAAIASGRDRGEVSLEVERKLEDRVADVAEEHRKATSNSGKGDLKKVREALDRLADEVDERTGEGLSPDVASRLLELVDDARRAVAG